MLNSVIKLIEFKKNNNTLLIEYIMNDTETEDSGSDNDCSSICDELEQLEKQLHNAHITLHDSIKTLENIHSLVTSNKNINVLCGGEQCDFDTILEKLHAATLERISSSTGRSHGGFSEALLKAIDDCEFC